MLCVVCLYAEEQQQVSDVAPCQLQQEMRGQLTTVVSDNVSQLEQQMKERHSKITLLSLLFNGVY